MKCDVLIVGAGCAGSVAALKLANAGLNVIVIDKAHEIGDHTKIKIDITEAVGLESIVEDLKLKILKKCKISKWICESESFTFDSRIADLYFKRGKEKDCFEVSTMNSAIKSNAKLLLSTQVSRFNFKGDNVDSVILKNRLERIEPKFIIIADGYESSTSKKAGFDNIEYKTSIAAYGIISRNIDIPSDITLIVLDNISAPGGYFYLGRAKDDIGVAAVVIDESLPKKTMLEYFEEFRLNNKQIRNALEKSVVVNTFEGRSKSFIRKKVVKGNIILIGDAAGMLNPVFGYGMRNAIISGYKAAECIIKNDVNSYKRIVKDEMDLSFDFKLRKIYKRLTNEDFRDLIILANKLDEKKGLDDVSTYDIIKELVYMPRLLIKSILSFI